MQKLLRHTKSPALRLRNRPGFTALAVLMLSLGVGATTALFSLVDGAMSRSAQAVRCETVMRVAGEAPRFAMAALPNGEELRGRVSDAYETSVETAGDALDALPNEIPTALADVSSTIGKRPLLAILGVLAIGFLVACTRGAAAMIASRRTALVAVCTMAGALVVATLSLHALHLPAIGVRAVAFALSISLVTVWFARLSQKGEAPLTI